MVEDDCDELQGILISGVSGWRRGGNNLSNVGAQNSRKVDEPRSIVRNNMDTYIWVVCG